jgi:hypothetical protein
MAQPLSPTSRGTFLAILIPDVVDFPIPGRCRSAIPATARQHSMPSHECPPQLRSAVPNRYKSAAAEVDVALAVGLLQRDSPVRHRHHRNHVVAHGRDLPSDRLWFHRRHHLLSRGGAALGGHLRHPQSVSRRIHSAKLLHLQAAPAPLDPALERDVHLPAGPGFPGTGHGGLLAGLDAAVLCDNALRAVGVEISVRPGYRARQPKRPDLRATDFSARVDMSKSSSPGTSRERSG